MDFKFMKERELKYHMGITDNFGLLFKTYRENRGYTLRHLEEMTGVSPSYINRIEKGERTDVSFGIVIRLAVCLNIPYNALISTALNELKADDFTREEATLTDVLIRESYCINGQVANKEDKQSLIKIMEFILQCQWNERSKVQDVYRLSELIEDFKVRF